MQRLYFHIRTHKTGTTALQEFLTANREWLLRNGICYPIETRAHHAPVADALAEGNREPLRRALTKAEASGAPVALFSSEGFSMRREAIRAALGDRARDTHIIIYLRRQDHYIQSLYQQIVKSPDRRPSESFHVFMEKLKAKADEKTPLCWDWYRHVSLWADAFGADKLIIRPYEKEQFVGGTIFTDFLHILGLAPADGLIIPSPEVSNIGYDFGCVELMRLTNASRDAREQAMLLAALDASGMREPAMRVRNSGGYLTAAERVELLRQCEEGNARLAREFMGRPDGRLFLEPWPDPHEPEPPRELTLETAVPVLMELILHEQIVLDRLGRDMKELREYMLLMEMIRHLPRRSRLRACVDIWLARSSGLMDEEYYLQQYPDVEWSGMDPIRHYVLHGWREGRNPSATFNTLQFIQEHPAMIATGWSPLVFEARGGLAGRWAARLRRKIGAPTT